MFVLCSTKKCKETGKKLFYYDSAYIMSGFKQYNLIEMLNNGSLYLDFDARTRHNHGTKIRVKKENLRDLFENTIVI